MEKGFIKTAFILGAGLGTRLRPLTDHCPKPLLKIADRPIITYAMDHLIPTGVQRFIVNTHHCAGVYDEIFPDRQWRGIPIVFRHEPVLLDTAGGLKNIEDLLDNGAPILVYNGDIISNLPLIKLCRAHMERKKEVTLALRSTGPLLNVNMNEFDEVVDMRHMTGNHGVGSYLFTGIYIVEHRFLKRLEEGRIESVVPVFVRMIQEIPGSIAGVVIDKGQWYDIGTVDEYRLADELFASVNWNNQ
jgi:mannose-1-phosphate guanylyltransferase